jgi:hypothetical protein
VAQHEPHFINSLELAVRFGTVRQQQEPTGKHAALKSQLCKHVAAVRADGSSLVLIAFEDWTMVKFEAEPLEWTLGCLNIEQHAYFTWECLQTYALQQGMDEAQHVHLWVVFPAVRRCCWCLKLTVCIQCCTLC